MLRPALRRAPSGLPGILDPVYGPPDPDVAGGDHKENALDADERHRDEQPGDGRPRDAREVHPGAIEGDGVREPAAAPGDLWKVGLAGRHVEGEGCPLEEAEHDQPLDGHQVRRQEKRLRQREEAQRRLGPEEDRALGVAIGEDASVRRQHDAGQPHGQGNESEAQGVAAQLIGEVPAGHLLHLHGHPRAHEAEPEDAKVPDLQRLEGPARGAPDASGRALSKADRRCARLASVLPAARLHLSTPEINGLNERLPPRDPAALRGEPCPRG